MEVVVVGGGLSGLTAACALSAAGVGVRVLEARQRLGGRMLTAPVEGAGWADLGATWHWDHQRGLRELAQAHGLAAFAQFDQGEALHEDAGPDGPAASRAPAPSGELRLEGGMQPLCERMAATLPDGAVVLGRSVSAVTAGDDGLTVRARGPAGDDQSFSADRVVMAIPPRLVVQDVEFAPALPDHVVEVLSATPTWMGDAVKCLAVYDSPFWRDQGLCGSAFSSLGPLQEVHDACSRDGSVAALWGFLANDPVRELAPGDRVELVLAQLGRLFGPAAADPVQYMERDWSADPNTNQRHHHHDSLPEYGDPVFREALFDGRLSWAGTETADRDGGHMEGAVLAGSRAAGQVLGSA